MCLYLLSINWEGEKKKKKNKGLQVQSKLPMLIYSDMSPHGATNPLGFLTDLSERVPNRFAAWEERKTTRRIKTEEERMEINVVKNKL